MGAFRIACQTITFGPEQKQRLAEVFDAVAAAGYQGVELGFRHVQHLNPAGLCDLLAARGLAAAAYHVGGNLTDDAQAAGERNMLETVLDFASVTQTDRLMYSGLRVDSPAALEADLTMLQEAARRAAGRGVQLLYHNHNWEFEPPLHILQALLERTDVRLCPDLGWVAKAGASPVDFLQANRARIGAVHFKDFASLEEGNDTVELGTGAAGLDRAAAWITDHLDNLWIIAEQDKTGKTPEQSVTENAQFLQQAFAGQLQAQA